MSAGRDASLSADPSLCGSTQQRRGFTADREVPATPRGPHALTCGEQGPQARPRRLMQASVGDPGLGISDKRPGVPRRTENPPSDTLWMHLHQGKVETFPQGIPPRPTASVSLPPEASGRVPSPQLLEPGHPPALPMGQRCHSCRITGASENTHLPRPGPTDHLSQAPGVGARDPEIPKTSPADPVAPPGLETTE